MKWVLLNITCNIGNIKQDEGEEKLNKAGIIKMALYKDLLNKLERVCVFANGNKGPVNGTSYEIDKYNFQSEEVIEDIFDIVKDYKKCINQFKIR